LARRSGSRLSYSTISLAADRADEALAQADAIIELEPDNATAYVLQAQSYIKLDRAEEAEAPLLRAIELDPEAPSFPVLLAAYYQQMGRGAEAEQQLKNSLAVEPTVTALNALGRLYTESGDRDEEAEAAFLQCIEVASERDEEGKQPAELSGSYESLARFYFLRERPEEAVATLELGIDNLDEPNALLFLLSRYLRSTGDEAGADALMLKAAENAGDDPTPLLTLSSLKSSRGDLAGALEAAQAATQAAPESVPARLRVAELLIDIGVREDKPERTAEGKAIIEAVLAEDPSSADALFVRAKYEIGTGDLDGAIDSLRQAMEIRPSWPQAHFVLGSALALRGETQRARAELARAVELEPALLEARGLLIKVHVELGEYEYAVEHGRVYLAARPEDDATRIYVAQSLVSLGRLDEAAETLSVIPVERQDVGSLYAIGRVRLLAGDRDGARDFFLRANELQPNNAKLLAALYSIDRSTGKISHSIKRMNDAVQAKPEDADLWSLRGSVEASAGNLAESESSLKKAIEFDPNHLDSYQKLGALYRATGRVDEMVALYEDAVKARPESAPAHHFLGVLYEMTGKVDDARAQYELALQYDPSLGESKNNLAYLMAEAGDDLDRALELAQEAKAAMPESANAADTLGWVLYKRGVSSAAVGYLRDAVQLADPDEPALGEIRLHLSLAYEASGDKGKAIETLEIGLAELERQKESGVVSGDPPWAGRARTRIETLRAAG
jgi:tetratricopeptide (TPR) repeat protein